jgi:hypothetical protein
LIPPVPDGSVKLTPFIVLKYNGIDCVAKLSRIDSPGAAVKVIVFVELVV